jgi:hypothetical protein
MLCEEVEETEKLTKCYVRKLPLTKWLVALNIAPINRLLIKLKYRA